VSNGEHLLKDSLNGVNNLTHLTMAKVGKKIWTSKTLWASLVTILTGLGMYFTGEAELQEITISIVGAVFAILRMVTTDPIA